MHGELMVTIRPRRASYIALRARVISPLWAGTSQAVSDSRRRQDLACDPLRPGCSVLDSPDGRRNHRSTALAARLPLSGVGARPVESDVFA